MAKPDRIDEIVDDWGRERPDLDACGFEIAGRISVLDTLLRRRMADALAPLELSLGEYEVLAVLRRQGSPYCQSPQQLLRATLLTSGAMTNRLDRLEAAGLVQRGPNPDDRRSVLVRLTEEGLGLVDRAIAVRFDVAGDVVGMLSKHNRKILSRLLRNMLADLDEDTVVS